MTMAFLLAAPLSERVAVLERMLASIVPQVRYAVLWAAATNDPFTNTSGEMAMHDYYCLPKEEIDRMIIELGRAKQRSCGVQSPAMITYMCSHCKNKIPKEQAFCHYCMADQ